MNDTKNYASVVRMYFPQCRLADDMEISRVQEENTVYVPEKFGEPFQITPAISVTDLAVFDNDGHISFSYAGKNVALMLRPYAKLWIEVTDEGAESLVLAKEIRHATLLDILASFAPQGDIQ